MNKLYLFITLLCMIELLLALLYLILYSDSIYDFSKMQNSRSRNQRYRVEKITQDDWDLLNKFIDKFSESELIRLHKILNIIHEKTENF